MSHLQQAQRESQQTSDFSIDTLNYEHLVIGTSWSLFVALFHLLEKACYKYFLKYFTKSLRFVVSRYWLDKLLNTAFTTEDSFKHSNMFGMASF